MPVIEAPIEYNLFRREGDKKLFIAGGITGCPEWQKDFISLLPDELVVFNPRRSDCVDIKEWEQISWEFKHLELADVISFWFCKETIQPITLFELGKWCGRNKPVFVGVEPGHERKSDIKLQLALERPNDNHIFDSLNNLATPIHNWFYETCHT